MRPRKGPAATSGERERGPQRENPRPRLSLDEDYGEDGEEGKADKPKGQAPGRHEQKDRHHDRDDDLRGERVRVEDPAREAAVVQGSIR